MYQIVIEKQAMKQLAQIPPPYYNKITEALKNLGNDTRPQGYKKLKGQQVTEYVLPTIV